MLQANQLPQDLMHVLFEGVLPLNLKLMLHNFIIDQRFFTLNCLNNRMFAFSYGRNEMKNRPTKVIDQAHLNGTKKLPFSGTSTRTCMYFVCLCPFEWVYQLVWLLTGNSTASLNYMVISTVNKMSTYIRFITLLALKRPTGMPCTIHEHTYYSRGFFVQLLKFGHSVLFCH